MIETNTASAKILQFQISRTFEKPKLLVWKTNEFEEENKIVELCLYILGTKYQFYSVIWTSFLHFFIHIQLIHRRYHGMLNLSIVRYNKSVEGTT
jgi:hypothetical protein